MADVKNKAGIGTATQPIIAAKIKSIKGKIRTDKDMASTRLRR